MVDFSMSTIADGFRSTIAYMETTGERLRSERIAAKLTQQQLADEAGVSKQAISQIETGGTKNPEAATISPVCRRLGITTHWLLTGRSPKYANDGAPNEDWSDILAFKQAAALGDGAVPDEYAETHKLKFRADSLQRKRLRPDRLGVVYGKGDSMLPRIKSGDAILFDRGDTTPRDGCLYVVSYDGALLAKQLVELGGRWFIQSLNRDDPKWRKPEPIDEYKSFKVHGRVRWIGSWED
jgi:phage repressor protein C with HTH and peptisase S24 domain